MIAPSSQKVAKQESVNWKDHHRLEILVEDESVSIGQSDDQILRSCCQNNIKQMKV